MKNTADQKLMRSINNKIVIDLLRKEEHLSRANISSITGLNRSTVSSIIDELIDEGWIRETSYQTNNVGRPGLMLEMNPEGGFTIGLEIGVDFILVVAVDFTAKVIFQKRIRTDPAEGQIKIQEKAFALVNEAIEKGKKECHRSIGIGIAVPGLVDTHEGVLKMAPNLHWNDVPIRLIWTQQFGMPVIVENEANAGALGEYFFGSAKGIDNFIYIAAGFGLGSGIIIDGKLLRGNKGFAAEVGHMTCNPEGELCNCGKRGCYEMLIGPRAVMKQVRKRIKEEGGAKTILQLDEKTADGFGYDRVVDAARQGDQIALEALEEVGEKLGIVVANLVNVFNPRMVVLGGALTYAKDFIQPTVIKVVKENALQLCQEDMVITNSQLDQQSSVMGVSGLIMENIWNTSNLY